MCYKSLGPGLLESAYKECLYFELLEAGINVKKRSPETHCLQGRKFDHGYRIDLLVEDKVVAELKTVEAFTDVHDAQVLTYLRLGDHRLGLLLNFHVFIMKNGIRRLVN